MSENETSKASIEYNFFELEIFLSKKRKICCFFFFGIRKYKTPCKI